MSKTSSHHRDIDRKADPLVRASADGDLRKVRSLVKAGVPVNAIGSKHWGYYPIHAAAEAGHGKVVSYLLRMGAKVDPRTAAEHEQCEETPLLLAALNGHLKAVRILVRAGADVNAKSLQKNTPLGRAIQYLSRSGERDRQDLFYYLLECGARAEPGHLRLAVREGNIEFVEYFLRHGLLLKSRDDQQFGSLLHCAIGRNQVEMVKLLIERGAGLNQSSGPFAETPLVKATSEGQWEIANYLLERNADPSLGSKHRAFPLNYAARREGLETAQLLLKAGAKVDSVDFEGKTPLEWAHENQDGAMLELLVKNGARRPKKLVDIVTRSLAALAQATSNQKKAGKPWVHGNSRAR